MRTCWLHHHGMGWRMRAWLWEGLQADSLLWSAAAMLLSSPGRPLHAGGMLAQQEAVSQGLLLQQAALALQLQGTSTLYGAAQSSDASAQALHAHLRQQHYGERYSGKLLSAMRRLGRLSLDKHYIYSSMTERRTF